MSNPPTANQEGNASNMQAVAAVGVKLPDFWKTDPEMWFAQAEAQFTLANITRDDTKYSHIVAKVDQTVICHIADLVHRPPLENKYNAVKEDVKPPAASNHGKRSVFISGDLKKCSHVFVRIDSVKRSLQHPYDGPYEVLERGDKSFNVLVAGKQQCISIDRLKPAFICNPEVNAHPQDDPATKFTPSGHRVRFLV